MTFFFDRMELWSWIRDMSDLDAHNLPLWVNRRFSLKIVVTKNREGERNITSAISPFPSRAVEHAVMAYRHDKAARHFIRDYQEE